MNQGKAFAGYFFHSSLAQFAQPWGSVTADSSLIQYKPQRAVFLNDIVSLFLASNGTKENSIILKTIIPELLSDADISQYHSLPYIVALKSMSSMFQSFPFYKEDIRKIKERFNIDFAPSNGKQSFETDPYNYARACASGSVGLADEICKGNIILGFNFFGGFSQPRKEFSINGYVNDVVLSVLNLLRRFERVLVISIGHGGTAVEEAFYTTSRVFTLNIDARSFMSDEKIHEREADIGFGDGKGFSFNAFLEDHASDEAFVYLMERLLEQVFQKYSPGAVVLQIGGSLLTSGIENSANITTQGFLKVFMKLRTLLQLNMNANLIPCLILGGSSANAVDTAKLWATLMLTMLNQFPGKANDFEKIDLKTFNGSEKLVSYFTSEETRLLTKASDIESKHSNQDSEAILERLNEQFDMPADEHHEH